MCNTTSSSGRPFLPQGHDQDWDEWKGEAEPDLDDAEDIAALRSAVIKKRRARKGRRSVTRDEWLRPIVDFQGIRDRWVGAGVEVGGGGG